MRKSISIALLIGCLGIGAQAQSSTLSTLQTDFDALLTGIARDIAPNLSMAALGGDVVGDATIDKFTIFVPSVGVTISDGIGTILRPSAHDWQFLIPMSSLVNTMVAKDAETAKWVKMITGELMAYPTIKLGFGVGFGSGWDAIVSGMFLPQALTDTIIGAAGPTVADLKPIFETYNLGIKVRKSFLEDSGAIPAFSLGLGYTLSGSTLGIAQLSLPEPIPVGLGNLDLSGKLGFTTESHNIAFDLHLSKHLLFVTPFVKLSGVYQYTKVTGDTELNATITPIIPPGTPAAVAAAIPTISQTLSSKPTVVISDFSAIATVGMEIYLWIFVLDANLAIDLARASFATIDNPLGFTGKAITANIIGRLAF